MTFTEEYNFLLKYEKLNKKSKLSNDDLNIIKSKYSNLPDDYINYLHEIGFGCIREIQFMIFSSLVELEDLGIVSDKFSQCIKPARADF